MTATGGTLTAIREELPIVGEKETATDGRDDVEPQTTNNEASDYYSVNSLDVMSSTEITIAGKDSTASVLLLPPHDYLVAHAENLLWEADKVLVASKRKKEDTLIQSLVSRINGKGTVAPPTNNPRTTTRGGALDNINTTSPEDNENKHTLHEKPALDNHPMQPSKKPFYQHYVLLVWKEADEGGGYSCKIPTAREPGQVQMMDIYPFACALWASGCLSESYLPNDLDYAKLEVFLYNDSTECEFVPQGEEAPKTCGRNHFSCTVVTANNSSSNDPSQPQRKKRQMVPQTEEEQKPYLCLIMALLRRLRKQATKC